MIAALREHGSKKFENLILSLCRDKEVLDAGCVGADKSKIGSSSWLHGRICKAAKNCIGIDIDRDGVGISQNHGYKVIWGNVETAEFDKKFDVVVAKDVVEHLSNLGAFLENLKKYLKRDGIMVIATPNVLSPVHFIHRLFGITPFCYDYEQPSFHSHAAWHSEDTLKTILYRHGWSINGIFYENHHSEPQTTKGKLFSMFLTIFSCFLPPRFRGVKVLAIATSQGDN